MNTQSFLRPGSEIVCGYQQMFFHNYERVLLHGLNTMNVLKKNSAIHQFRSKAGDVSCLLRSAILTRLENTRYALLSRTRFPRRYPLFRSEYLSCILTTDACILIDNF
ncbi:hypothetical protein [Nostoc sp. ChiQUE02]|uniref:hypothetical protein n=1 Tax=Nostoc sp. ChiQUE02 TaxID=3075377 RepID=UPI003D161882